MLLDVGVSPCLWPVLGPELLGSVSQLGVRTPMRGREIHFKGYKTIKKTDVWEKTYIIMFDFFRQYI